MEPTQMTKNKVEQEFDHPCKETCSGYKQGLKIGYEKGYSIANLTEELTHKSCCTEITALNSRIEKLREALEFSLMTLEHAIALDYLGEGSTKGMAEDAISIARQALAEDDGK